MAARSDISRERPIPEQGQEPAALPVQRGTDLSNHPADREPFPGRLRGHPRYLSSRPGTLVSA